MPYRLHPQQPTRCSEANEGRNSMTAEERATLMREIFEKELVPITIKKGHDYAGNQDCLSNLNDFGWKGVVVRISDKYHRLKNFTLSDQLMVKDENIEDTIKDMINYLFFAMIMKRRG